MFLPYEVSAAYNSLRVTNRKAVYPARLKHGHGIVPSRHRPKLPPIPVSNPPSDAQLEQVRLFSPHGVTPRSLFANGSCGFLSPLSFVGLMIASPLIHRTRTIMEVPIDADQIYREVSKRQERAVELDVPRKTMSVCIDSLIYYRHWMKHFPEVIPPRITDVEYIESKLRDSVRFKFDGRQYAFRFLSRYSFGDHYHYDFLFSFGDSIVLHCVGLCRDASHDTGFGLPPEQLRALGYVEVGHYWYKYSPTDIGAFVEGKWIDDVKYLAEHIQSRGAAVARARAKALEFWKKQEREDPKRLELLRKQFGIT